MNDLRRRAAFYRQLAVCLDAGLSLHEALRGLTESDPGAARALAALDRGGSLADSLAGEAGVLAAEGEFLRASEISGSLPEALRRLSDDAESAARARARMANALLYPALLALGGAFLVPLGTWIRAGFAAYLRESLFCLALLAAVAAAVFALMRASRSAHAGGDAWLLRLPVAGPLFRNAALSRICQALSLLTGAGLPLPRSLRSAADSSGSATYGAAVRGLAAGIERGGPLGAPARRSGLFPPEFCAYLDTGERTGEIASQMKRAHEHFREEWERSLAGATRAARAVAYGAIALGVAWQIVAGFLSVFSELRVP